MQLEFELLQDIPGVAKGVIFVELSEADKPTHASKARLFAPKECISPTFSLLQIENNRNWFKKLNQWPASWEDLGKISGYYVNDCSDIELEESRNCSKNNQNIYTTEAFAKRAIAEAKLSQLAKAMNGDWIPDWTDEESYKYTIDRSANKVRCICYITSFNTIVFKTEEMAEFSFKHHYDLWKDYWML